MAIPARLLTINLGTATVSKTEDDGADGDEIYVDGRLVAKSATQPPQGKDFPFDPRNIVQFSLSSDPKFRTEATRQLQPRQLYRRFLPADARATVRLFFRDADGAKALSPEEVARLREATRAVGDEFERRVREAVDNEVLRALIIYGVRIVTGAGVVDAVLDLVDPPDLLGEDFRTIDLSSEPAGTRRVNLRAAMDDADYGWFWAYTLSPVMQLPDGTDLDDPSVIAELLGPTPPSSDGTVPPGNDGGPETPPDDGNGVTPGVGGTPSVPPVVKPGPGDRILGNRTIDDRLVTPFTVGQ